VHSRRHRLGRIQQVRDWPGPDLGGLLISLCSADRAPDPAVLRNPGGFTWFYVDLVDEQGRGATLIWSWGLPFLPGYAKAARAGHPQLPIERPSVNLVVYEGGREIFYLLSELPPEQWGRPDPHAHGQHRPRSAHRWPGHRKAVALGCAAS
jgi:hypothetical protein